MDEIVDQIAAATGVTRPVVARAVGIILGFLAEAAPGRVDPLLDKLPGARAAAAANMGSGGSLIGVFNALTAAGLGMGEVQSLTRAFIEIARAQVGTREVDAVIAAIPGLGQFV
jgi:hypothetical protein